MHCLTPTTNQHESNHITHPNNRLLRHWMVQREGGNPAS
jgi:hypothetical protein